MRITQWITGAALAAAFLVAAPHKADAQVRVGIGFGYAAPVYGYGYLHGPIYGGYYHPGYGWYRGGWVAPAPAPYWYGPRWHHGWYYRHYYR